MTDSFKAAGYSWKLFCGDEVIEAHLTDTVKRAGANRAFVICSPSINKATDLVHRITLTLGDRFAGCFGGIENDSTYISVQAATDAALAAKADLLIAVGGGSVMVATRAVAIFLAETGSPFELMTQYPKAGGRPHSPRLMAPKLPIINIPTTPTSAMNRAGTGLKNPELDQRMEYFDPKTRPQAILIDDAALMSVPASVLHSTETTVFCGVIDNAAQPASNPLVEADQQQARQLACDAYLAGPQALAQVEHRRNLALAAFLQNRAEDDGRKLVRASAFAGDYAVSTALHLFQPAIGQGESTCVLVASALRLAKQVPSDELLRVGRALGVQDRSPTVDNIAEALEATFAKNKMPIQLRTLPVTEADLPKIAGETVNNFNAIAGGGTQDAQARVDRSLRLLQAAW